MATKTIGSWLTASLVLGLVAVTGCGGGAAAAGPGSGSGSSTAIPSMPQTPPTAEPSTATTNADAPAGKLADPRTICAGAAPNVKVSVEGWSPRGPVALGELEKAALGSAPPSASKAKPGTYSLADLQALEQRSAWEELLEHASDIPPAARNATWEKLVERAGIGYMTTLTTGSAAYEGVWSSQTLIRRYPHLTASKDFMAKRGEAGKVAAEQCLRDAYRGQHCLEMMNEFLKTTNTGADVGFAFGKITRKNQNHYVAVPFFKWALDQKKDASWCSDEDLGMAVVAGLGLPTDYENAAGARQVAAGACFDKLVAPIKKELTEHPTGYFRDNACAVLKAKGAL